MIASFFDELEKIALSQGLLTRAYTKATHLAERYGRQGDKWRQRKGFPKKKLKDPQRSEKAYKKARRYSGIGQAIKKKLEEEPRSLKLRNVSRGEHKHFRQIFETRQAVKQKAEQEAKRKMRAEVERQVQKRLLRETNPREYAYQLWRGPHTPDDAISKKMFAKRMKHHDASIKATK